jgi:hypothetical protein
MSNGIPKYHCELCDKSFVNKRTSKTHLASTRHITQQKNILSEKRKERKLIGLQFKKDEAQHKQIILQLQQLIAQYEQSGEQLKKSFTQFEELDLYIQKVKSYQVVTEL